MPQLFGIVPVDVPDGIDGAGARAGQVWTADGQGGAAFQTPTGGGGGASEVPDFAGASDGDVLTVQGGEPNTLAWEPVTGGNGGGGITDITYADLVAAIGASGLAPGAFYRITDFATRHFIVDGNGVQYTGEGNQITGTTEPLIVQAVSANELALVACSEIYPQDVLHYDWNPIHHLTDPGFTDLTDSQNPVIISDFTGVITFRHDTLLNNSAHYDYRACKARRWSVAAAMWDSQTQYDAGNLVKFIGEDATGIYRALQTGMNQQPDMATDYWILLFDVTTFDAWNAAPTEWNNIPSGEEYLDLPWLADAVSSNNHVDSNLVESGNTRLANNTFGPGCNSNTFGAGCYSNTFGTWCNGNTFGAWCYGNTFGAWYYGNTFGAGCNGNTFGAWCYSNTFGPGVQINRVADGALNGLDLSNATASPWLYANYNCEILLNVAYAPVLRYLDADNLTVIVALPGEVS